MTAIAWLHRDRYGRWYVLARDERGMPPPRLCAGIEQAARYCRDAGLALLGVST